MAKGILIGNGSPLKKLLEISKGKKTKPKEVSLLSIILGKEKPKQSEKSKEVEDALSGKTRNKQLEELGIGFKKKKKKP